MRPVALWTLPIIPVHTFCVVSPSTLSVGLFIRILWCLPYLCACSIRTYRQIIYNNCIGHAPGSPNFQLFPHFDSYHHRRSHNIPQTTRATLVTTPTTMNSRSTQRDAPQEPSSWKHRPPPPSRTPSFLAGFALTPLSSLSQTSQAFPKLKQSYENLVALANAREALRQTRQEAIKHGKQVRKMVWRDKGEPPVELRSLEDCIEHAVRGGSRKYPFYWYSIGSYSAYRVVL
jgi:hypothetical protein